MISSTQKGNFGEDAALRYLIDLGYSILSKNFRNRYGEIDIIGEDDGIIAFIEVKARESLEFGLPCEAVDKRKQRQIARMALLYIARNSLEDRACRFDVVEVVLNSGSVKYMRLIKDAFQAD